MPSKDACGISGVEQESQKQSSKPRCLHLSIEDIMVGSAELRTGVSIGAKKTHEDF